MPLDYVEKLFSPNAYTLYFLVTHGAYDSVFIMAITTPSKQNNRNVCIL